MELRQLYDFSILVNESERMVIDELERQLNGVGNQGDCLCEDCVLDIAALAMNSVKPLYRVSLLGSLYAHAADGTEYGDAVRAAVTGAVEKVRKNPSHD
ncbi:MAG TPA: late competence development ComFB family protein [Magnetospirillaceae bacterium]|nr:late competence development ComFB family protein [Magnetospirillaceae bacterium]